MTGRGTRDLRRDLSRSRCRDAAVGPRYLELGEAAWLLCRDRGYVRELIRAQELRSDPYEDDAGRYRHQIPRGEVIALARRQNEGEGD